MVGSLYYYKGRVIVYCSPGVVIQSLMGEADLGAVYFEAHDSKDGEILEHTSRPYNGTAESWHRATALYLFRIESKYSHLF